jgi:hypothetical protein
VTQATKRPAVVVAPEIQVGLVPELRLADASTTQVERPAVHAAAAGLALRLRPEHIERLPVAILLEVVVGDDVEIFHYSLTADQVTLDRQAASDPEVSITLQKAVDLILLDNGISLVTIVSSGRASLSGEVVDLLQIFGMADYPAASGRRSFADLSQLLLEARTARPREVSRILDRFGRADFARELTHFFTDAAQLSGLAQEIPPATIRVTIGDHGHLCHISPERCWVEPAADGAEFQASIDVPKMETMVDRLLGNIGDMDAILSRRMVVAGPAVDDLMPLFERISTGLTVFTSLNDDDGDWSFPVSVPG